MPSRGPGRSHASDDGLHRRILHAADPTSSACHQRCTVGGRESSSVSAVTTSSAVPTGRSPSAVLRSRPPGRCPDGHRPGSAERARLECCRPGPQAGTRCRGRTKVRPWPHREDDIVGRVIATVWPPRMNQGTSTWDGGGIGDTRGTPHATESTRVAPAHLSRRPRDRHRAVLAIALSLVVKTTTSSPGVLRIPSWDRWRTSLGR